MSILPWGVGSAWGVCRSRLLRWCLVLRIGTRAELKLGEEPACVSILLMLSMRKPVVQELKNAKTTSNRKNAAHLPNEKLIYMSR